MSSRCLMRPRRDAHDRQDVAGAPRRPHQLLPAVRPLAVGRQMHHLRGRLVMLRIEAISPASARAALTRVYASISEDPVTGCWVWQGAPNTSGYGSLRVDGRRRLAHRVSFVAHMGRDVAPGMTVGHVCHDTAARSGDCAGGVRCLHRLCVNPAHLREQSQRENTMSTPNSVAGMYASRATCAAGHPLEAARIGRRVCRTCAANSARANREAVNAARNLLGMTREQYAAVHGYSTATAWRIVRELS